MVDRMEITSLSANQTQKLAFNLAQQLVLKNNIICLYGDLGSGKTNFVQGLARGLGIKSRILSPTFILMRLYPFKIGKIKKILYHVDLYRMNNLEETESLGLTELWTDPENIITIEWAEKISKLLPQRRTDIKFQFIPDNENARKIILEEKE